MRTPSIRSGLRRGFRSGLAAAGLLAVAALPARIDVVMRGHDSLWAKVSRALAGVALDLSAAVVVLVPTVIVLTLLVPLVLPWARRPVWQKLGSVVVSLPLGFAFWVLGVVARQVKAERGAFPTMFDLAEGGGNASFVEGTLGFIAYDRVWMPGLAGAVVAFGVVAVVIAVAKKGTREVVPWWPWALGLCSTGVVGLVGLPIVVSAQAQVDNRFSPAALGDPWTGLIESSVDLVMARGPSTPRALVVTAKLPEGAAAEGARRLGWSPRRKADAGEPCFPHPYARPLDLSREPPTRDPRGTRLLRAMEEVSTQLFAQVDPTLALFFVSLESFRADDVHALNPQAPRDIDPYVTSLYEAARRGGQGVLSSSQMYQAGVRTAQGLGAFTCGIGTLPYNLAFIRDLHPFPLRCASDVWHDANFEGSFFYGSDPTFDDMHVFLKEHGYATVVAQDDMPKGYAKGAWGGATDFVVFDEALLRVGKALKESGAPQFSLVMSLSNHSPFTPPEDLPKEVTQRVDEALKTQEHRADADDRRRILAHAYTDAAVERFFSTLSNQGLAERSVVIVTADHSTGEAYIWGPEPADGDSEAAKAQVPFLIVFPTELLARLTVRPEFDAALARVQALLEEAPLSQNDVPSMILALLSAHPNVKALPASRRWHTLGGQVTSPYFAPGKDDGAYLLGINGVSELFALGRDGARLGAYEDSAFLKTRADRYRVTPRLIPVTATLADIMANPVACPGGDGGT